MAELLAALKHAREIIRKVGSWPTLQPEIDAIDAAIAKAERPIIEQRDEALAALLRYGQHKPGCASQWRAATGSSQIGPCDCGLGAAIAKVVRQ